MTFCQTACCTSQIRSIRPRRSPANNHIYLYGGLGAGVIVASSTEDIFTDLFIAIPASTGNSAAKLSGTYQVASLEFLGGDFGQTRNTFFTMNADGAGGLGNVTVKGTAQSFSGAAQAQTSSAATYTVTGNGSGTLVLPAPSGLAAGSVLLSGNKVLFAECRWQYVHCRRDHRI